MGVMKPVVFTALLLASVCLVSFASIPTRSNLRFNQVDATNVAPNAVSVEDIQDYSVGRHQLLGNAVWESKLAPLADSEKITPGAVTTSGASIDLVELVISQVDTIPSRSMNAQVFIPEDVESIQPYEAVRNQGIVRVDNPNPNLSYRIEGKARGSGVILGWYPSQNAHLLRYQSSRALRGIVCSAIDIQIVRRRNECFCAATPSDTNGDDDNLTVGCSCSIDITYIDTQWDSEIDDCTACTVLDCGDPNATQNDPMCSNISTDQRENPFDNDSVNQPDYLPDRCNPYTSVEDVNNPQEGVPVYSPSVERIQIDENGSVEMWFFGRGTIEVPHDDIVITVVVLLDDQYGA